MLHVVVRYDTLTRNSIEVNGHDRSLPYSPPKELDEASLIQERRKMRDAIKARHRGQASPFVGLVPPIDESETNLAGSTQHHQTGKTTLMVPELR